MVRRLRTRLLRNKGYGQWRTAPKAATPLMQHQGIGRAVKQLGTTANRFLGLTITPYRALTFHKDRSKMTRIKERYGTLSPAHTSTAITRPAIPSQLTMVHHPRTGFNTLDVGEISNTQIRTRGKIRSSVFRRLPSTAVGRPVLEISRSTALRCVCLRTTRSVLSVHF